MFIHFQQRDANHCRFSSIILVSLLIVLSLSSFSSCGKKNDLLSYAMPLTKGTLRWGMTEKEVSAVLGEGEEKEETSTYETAYSYNSMDTAFGSCKAILTFYDTSAALGKESGEKKLVTIALTLETDSFEEVGKEVERLYGPVETRESQVLAQIVEGLKKTGVPAEEAVYGKEENTNEKLFGTKVREAQELLPANRQQPSETFDRQFACYITSFYTGKGEDILEFHFGDLVLYHEAGLLP